MMRFVLGLFIVMGAVGGLEQNTMTINQCLAFSMMGLSLRILMIELDMS